MASSPRPSAMLVAPFAITGRQSSDRTLAKTPVAWLPVVETRAVPSEERSLAAALVGQAPKPRALAARAPAAKPTPAPGPPPWQPSKRWTPAKATGGGTRTAGRPGTLVRPG